MSLGKTLQRNRLAQVLLSIVSLTVILFLFFRSSPKETHTSSSNALTNEEINNLLSGDFNSGSDIQRVNLYNQTLKAPFLDTALKSNNWEVLGDTLIKNWEYVRLTAQKKDQAGLIFNKNSFNDDGFQVELNFSIHGDAKINQLKGDGMALFLTDKPLNLGVVFGAEDRFNGLGVFFDTYRNARKGPVFPYISVMNGDGYASYDKANDGKENEIAGCTARSLYNTKQGYVTARLIHTVDDGYLSLDYNYNDEWRNCFSIKDVHIPKERYLGIGAATGELVEVVDLYDVKVFSLKQNGETIDSWNDFIEHIDEPDKDLDDDEKDIRDAKDELEDSDYDLDHNGRNRKRRQLRKRRNAKQRAKLRAKLRNKERRRLKFNAHKRLETESDGVGFLRTLWWLIKKFVLLTFASLVFYIGFTVYRVKRRTWRSKRKTTGLLD